MTCIRQVATLLGHGGTTALPTKLYWVLFLICNLGKAVETTKRILTKEKTDRQLARQSSSTIFMGLKDDYNKKVTFDTWGRLEERVDKVAAMIGKLATRDNGNNRQFKLHIYQSRGRGQNRNFYDSSYYERVNYQGRYISNSGDMRFRFSGQRKGRPRYEQNYRR